MSPFEQMRAKEAQLDADYVRERLDYDPNTGEFHWRSRFGDDLATKRWNGKFAGTRAGSIKHGYTMIGLGGKVYHASRLAHLYMTGGWPVNLMNHRSRAGSNNCWNNLREATHSELSAYSRVSSTNTSGFRGVSGSDSKWHAQTRKDKHSVFLGLYATPEEAAQAYNIAAEELHGEFANINPQEGLPTNPKRRPQRPSNTGVRGVLRLGDGRYRAARKIKGKNIFLGNFNTLEAAALTYRNATQPGDADAPIPQRITRKLGKSGFRGVRQSGSKFVSRITIAGRELHLGTFANLEEAAEAYTKAKAALAGEPAAEAA